MNLIETLRDQLDDNTISQLRDEIGAESNEQTESAATAVISSIIAGLNRNVHQPAYLMQHHTASILAGIHSA